MASLFGDAASSTASFQMVQPTDLKNAKARRTVIRRKITEKIKGINERSKTNDQPASEALEQYMIDIQGLEANISILDAFILNSLEGEVEIGTEMDQQEGYLAKLQGAKRIIRVWSTQLGTTDTGPQQRISENSSGVRLPQLELGTFDGIPGKYQGWWELFSSCVHDNPQLIPSVKFRYLKQCLRGQALKAISHLLVNTDNYKEALNILEKRFGQKSQLILAHMQSLNQLPTVGSIRSSKELREFFDYIMTRINGLKVLGQETTSYGPLLSSNVLRSLPAYFVANMRRYVADKRQDFDGVLSIEEIMEYIESELEHREFSEAYSVKEEHHRSLKGQQPMKQPRGFPNSGGSTGSFTTSAQSSSSLHKECLFCKREHETANCTMNLAYNDKMKILKEQKACFKCCKVGHNSSRCRSAKWISCGHCQGKHAGCICRRKFCTEIAEETKVNSDGTVMTCQPGGSTLLPTVVVWVGGLDSRRLQARGLLDCGSQRSFISDRLANKAQLPVIRKECLRLSGFGQGVSEYSNYDVVRGRIENYQDPRQSMIMELVKVPILCNNNIPVPDDDLLDIVRNSGHSPAEMQNDTQQQIDIIIGADAYYKIVKENTINLSEDGALRAVSTMFGYTIMGPMNCESSSQVSATSLLTLCLQVVLENEETELLSKQLRDFHELDAVGIDDRDGLHNPDIKSLCNPILSGGRYTVNFPWKTEAPLKDNIAIAQARLNNLYGKLSRTPELLKLYHAGVLDLIKQGIVIETSKDYSPKKPHKTFYLPHRGIIRNNKLRIVFDASAKTPDKGDSLNSQLYTGPNLNPELVHVLLRFRIGRVAIIGDIKQAFLQIRIAEDDQNSLRFLWYREEPTPEKRPQSQTFQITRVPFGAGPSPFLLKLVIQELANQQAQVYPKVTDVVEDFYVDDLLHSCDTEEEAVEIVREVIDCFAGASMELRKWSSNREQVERQIAEFGCEIATPICPSTGILKVLGLEWNKVDDTFSFTASELAELLKTATATKRTVLQIGSRLYDPIGFLLPFTITVRLLFRDCWYSGSTWDSVLSPDLWQRFVDWTMDLQRLTAMTIPRQYAPNECLDEAASAELHVFTDASESAYGTAAYIRIVQAGRVSVSIVMAKSRVSPAKKQTLPRLELLGALLGARLSRYVETALGKRLSFTNRFFWTDSTVALAWIKGDHNRWGVFVSNRTREIGQLTNTSEWSHVPGTTNPADLLTRGVSASRLVSTQCWWHGPDWLSKDQSHWPQLPSTSKEEEVWINDETRKAYTEQAILTVSVTPLKSIICYQNFSELRKLQRGVAYLIDFIQKFKHTYDVSRVTSNSERYAEALIMIIRDTQARYFQQELHDLRVNRTVRCSSKLYHWNPVIDNNLILRLSTRIRNTDSTIEMPIILPAEAPLSKLIIQRFHVLAMHFGVNTTIARVRDEGFWIFRCRQVARKVVSECRVCRKVNARPFQQVTGLLPEDRTTRASPFEVTGFDFAGPVRCKQGHKRTTKAYIGIFTCAVTRAIHLELVASQGTFDFLLALRRMTARRGTPRVIYSDNAPSLHRADNDLRLLWKGIRGGEEVKKYFGESGIQWKFIPERAAWWGGWWERIVKTVKQTLKKVLGTALLTSEEFSTVLCEVEACVNSRPLTYVDGTDPNELRALKPMDFLLCARSTLLPRDHTAKPNSGASELRIRHALREKILTDFWKRWQSEYINQLRSAHEFESMKGNVTLRPGDVVLVAERNLARSMWRLASVIEPIIGRDQRVRACRIRFATGHETRRAVQDLCLLESAAAVTTCNNGF